jgi:hypothetical protein
MGLRWQARARIVFRAWIRVGDWGWFSSCGTFRGSAGILVAGRGGAGCGAALRTLLSLATSFAALSCSTGWMLSGTLGSLVTIGLPVLFIVWMRFLAFPIVHT